MTRFWGLTIRRFWLATILTVVTGSVAVVDLRAQSPAEPVALWPGKAPGAVGDEDQDRPTLTAYPAPKEIRTGAAVVICPGGGYAVLATDHEGHQVAQWFNSIGVQAYVLKYRLGRRYQHPIPLTDVQRAIRWVRHHAAEEGLSPRRIGVMGFSAGGHLASTAATHFDAGDAQAADPIERLSCRPDFAVLGYPVISFTAPFGHSGSKRNLLGDEPDPKLVEALSNERQVTPETPPSFLFHTSEDRGVPPDNSIVFYQACVKAGVPAELHLYQFGPHGVGLAHGDPVVFTWKDRLADWLQTNGLLVDCERAPVEGTIQVAGKPLRWGSVTFTSMVSPRHPVAWAMVSNGKYQIPAGRGAVVGPCRIEVRDLGAVEPRVTLPEVRLMAVEAPRTITKERNTVDLALP